MVRVALQSALIGLLTGGGALWFRFGRQWWPATPLEKAAYRVLCPACPFDLARRAPELRDALGLVLLCALIYALAGVGIEAARRLRRGDSVAR